MLRCARLCVCVCAFATLSSPTSTRATRSQVAEQTHINVSICERNFANYKRVNDVVLAAAEKAHVDPVKQLRRTFLLSDALARQYVRATFVGRHQWNFARKRVAHISFSDVEQLAAILIDRWTARPYWTLGAPPPPRRLRLRRHAELDPALRLSVRSASNSPFATKKTTKLFVQRVMRLLRDGAGGGNGNGDAAAANNAALSAAVLERVRRLDALRSRRSSASVCRSRTSSRR